MYKALLFGLKDRYSLNALVETRTFEPVFSGENEHFDQENLSHFNFVCLYMPQPDFALVKQLRADFCWRNIVFYVFYNNPDEATTWRLRQAGADYAAELPKTDADMIKLWQQAWDILDEAASYRHPIVRFFEESVKEIVMTMAVLDLHHRQTYLTPALFYPAAFTGVMAMGGKQKGLLCASFSPDLAANLVSTFTATPVAQLSKTDIFDGIAEITNMIAGGTKARIEDPNMRFELTTPFVVEGLEYRIHPQPQLPGVVIVLEGKDGAFAIRINLLTLKR